MSAGSLRVDYVVSVFAERREAMGFFCQFFQLRVGVKATISPHFEKASVAGKEKTFFSIECQIGDGNIWTVKKRFSEVTTIPFYKLSQDMATVPTVYNLSDAATATV